MTAWGRRYRMFSYWGIALLMLVDGPHGPHSTHTMLLASCFFLLAVTETVVLAVDWVNARYKKRILPKIEENIHEKWDRVYGTGKYRRMQP